MSRVLAGLALLVLLAASPAWADPLIARVRPEWSPFMAEEVGDPTGLITEARKLMVSDPARVAEVLKNAVATSDPVQRRVIQGLLADALYQRGNKALFEAARSYRAMLIDNPDYTSKPWLFFMDGNVKKILGFSGEARFSYEEAIKSGEKPWSAAVLFNLCALELEAGNHRGAARLLDDWLAKYRGQQGTALVLYMLTEISEELGDHAASIGHYDQAAALDRQAWLIRPQIGYRIADALQAAGRNEEAALELEKIGERAPGSAEGAKSRLATGEMWVQKGRIELAARAYAQLADEKPTPDQLEEAQLRLALLGVLYSDELELKEFFPAYKEFYRPRERFEEVLAKSRSEERKQLAEYGLGELERKEGQVERALDHYIKAFKKYPETPMSGRAYDRFVEEVELEMGHAVERKEFKEAADLFEKHLEPARWSPQRDLGLLHYQAGRAYIGMGSSTKGKKALEDALLMGTKAVEPEVIREELLRARVGDREPAAMAAWVAKNPEDQAARLELARVQASKGEVAAAREQYDEALKREKDPGRKVEIIRESGRYAPPTGADEALKELDVRKRLLQKAGKDAGNREDLQEARLKFAAGDQAKAMALFEKIPDLGADDRYLLALCYRSAGKPDQAVEIFEALKEDKTDKLVADLASLHLEVMALEAREGGGTVKPTKAGKGKAK